ncbi:MAG: UpxY family transcription antiterminator [Pseudomonadota bacterium]
MQGARDWYVLHTKSRFEEVVSEGLSKKTLDAFLPKIATLSKRRDRRQVIRVPLFPGYVFVKSDLNPEERLKIIKTIGVVRIVGNNDGPIPVSGDVINSLQIMTAGDSNVYVESARLHKGDKVIVVSGPFTGIVGIFVRYQGIGRVVVTVDLLGQSAAVEVDESLVERIL